MNVIIPTTGQRLAGLKECIISLSKQTLSVNITVILKPSTPQIKKSIETLCNEYGCVLLFEPYRDVKGSHRAVACNYGLNNTESEFVAFVDDDVSVPPTWVENAIKYFKDSVAGVTTGCNTQSSPFHLVQTIGSDSHAKNFTKTTSIESIPGYNSIYLRRAVSIVGGFNEYIGGCEDWELNYRLREHGWMLLGIPEAPVIHRHSYTWHSFIKQMFGYGWSRSRFFRIRHHFTIKHAIPSISLLLLPFLFLDLRLLIFALGSYTTMLIFLSLITKPSNPKIFFRTILTFLTMHISWALGYLKGLVF